MPYPSSVDANQIQPWIISNDPASLAGAVTVTLVANQVYLYAFELPASVTFTGAKWRMGATATGTTDLGIYDANGNLLGHTGAITNTASTNMSNAFTGGNLQLAAGQYFMAMVPSNSTDTYLAAGSASTLTGTTRFRSGTTAGTAGVLPNTTGGYTDAISRAPAMALTNLNGLT